MTARARIAVVGAGVIGRTHLATLARSDRLVLAGLVDPMPAAAGIAAEAGVPFFRTVEDLLAAARPDGVIVASPNATHLPVARACLAAGVPVLLEKPPADSLAEAQELIDTASATGVPVLVGHHRRHNPIVRAARTAVAEGRLGDLVLATVLVTLKKDAAYFAVPWRSVPGSGGPLRINLVHEIDLLRYLFGEVAAVTAQVSDLRRGGPVEDSAAVTLRFANGGLAALTISDAAAGPWAWETTAGEGTRFPPHPARSHFFSGAAGALSLPDLEFWTHPAGGDWTHVQHRAILPHGPGETYALQLDHFAEVIAGAAPVCDALDGARSMATVEAIVTAAGTGRETPVPELRTGPAA